MQLLKNLYQLGGDFNGLSFAGVDMGFEDCNTYLLTSSAGHILFDAGCGDTEEQLFARMRYWGLDPGDIRYCLLTHAHYDHAGGAKRLQERGIEIVANAETAEAVSTGDERCCGFLYHKMFSPFYVDKVIEDDDTLRLLGVEMQVMHVPGHSMGCTAYLFTHESQRIAVSGDLIGTLGVGDFGWSGSIDFDKQTYIESLKRFARVDMDLMLPGHGPIYFHQPRRRVERVLNAALMQWR